MTRLEVAFKLAKTVAVQQIEIEHRKGYIEEAKKVNDIETIRHNRKMIENLMLYIIGIRKTVKHFNLNSHDIMRITHFLCKELNNDIQAIEQFKFQDFKNQYDLKRV